MDITFVLPTMSLAGGNRVVAIYAKRLQDRGHRVKVVSGARRAPSPLQRLKSLVRGRGWPATIAMSKPYFEDLGVDVKVLATTGPILEGDVPDGDVVIATWWETAEWVAKLGPRKGAKAYFVQHHEVFPYLPVARSRATYRLPLKKIVISQWLKELMAMDYGDDTCVLIPNSVDTRQFFATKRAKQSVPTIGFLYSTVDFKDPATLLKTLEHLKRRVPGVRAIAFGAEQVSSDYPLPEWVEFHYRPPQNDIRLLYAQSDVWLCASRSEGFHLPPLEAMACRCPVVSTRVGGPLDIVVDGHNGYLVEVGDFEGLVDRLAYVLELREEEWAHMSQSSEDTALRYTWDDASDLFEQAVGRLSKLESGRNALKA
jgi:glycosyltransferase involved in cell wall biosynthesis